MIWIISSFDTAKSLKEPQKISMKEIWYAHSELLKICGMNGQSQKVFEEEKFIPWFSVIYFLYLSNVVMEIWKDKHAFTQHVLQLWNLPLKSFLENEMQKLGANQRLKSGIFCVLECGICTGRIRNPALGIWSPQRGIQNLILSWSTLHGV